MGSLQPEELSLRGDLRRAFSALLATATGTLAGIVVDSGFTVREAVLRPVYWLLSPLFDLFSRFPNAQLVAAGVIDRLPVVVIVGLGAGMALRKLRYPRMLLVATVVWPACTMVRKVVMALFPDDPPSVVTNSLVPELAMYVVQYAILIAIIRATNGLVTRQDPLPPVV